MIRSIAPGAEIADISHLIEPFGVREGAMLLYESVPYFPQSVHLAITSGGGDASQISTFTYMYWTAKSAPRWSDMTQAQVGTRNWNFTNGPDTGTLNSPGREPHGFPFATAEGSWGRTSIYA